VKRARKHLFDVARLLNNNNQAIFYKGNDSKVYTETKLRHDFTEVAILATVSLANRLKK